MKLYKEVAIFSIMSLKIRSYWYCEIMKFSGIIGIGASDWVMSTVNLQNAWSECVYLKKVIIM